MPASESAAPAWATPTVRDEVMTAAICRNCPWHKDGMTAIEYAYEHARETGHHVSAEHRKRQLWDWKASHDNA